MNLYQVLGDQIAPVYQATALVLIILFAGGLVVRRRLATTEAGLLPDEGFSIRNIFEILVEMMADQGRSIIGEGYRAYFPLVGTIFFFILVSNLMGLFPGLGGATSYVETTTAWAIISVVIAEYVGIRTHGFGYIKHFLGPVWWLSPVFFVLEIPLHLARVLTLSVRLLANMFADHTIVAAWLALVPFVIPAGFMGLGLVIAVLQAFVFSLLTMIYIGLALEEAH